MSDITDSDRDASVHRAPRDTDRHVTTGERTVDSAELPDELAVTAAAIADDALRVTWRHDGRTSAFPLTWLRAHAYAVARPEVPPPPSDVADRGAAILRAHGALGTATPEHTEALIAALDGRALRVIGTHFGRIEDLRTDNTTNANTDQLGYTDAPIELHTDQPFHDHPPRYQLLHAVRAADVGGDSLIADARAAFRYLQATDPDAAARLTTTPVVFHRRQRAFERVVTAPIIVDSPDRFAVPWYRAYDRFGRLVRDPRHHYRFQLAPGDALLYDNHRVLHGRTGFRGPGRASTACRRSARSRRPTTSRRCPTSRAPPDR